MTNFEPGKFYGPGARVLISSTKFTRTDMDDTKERTRLRYVGRKGRSIMDNLPTIALKRKLRRAVREEKYMTVTLIAEELQKRKEQAQTRTDREWKPGE